MPNPPPETLLTDRYPTPVGEAILVFDERGRLRALDFFDHEGRMQRLLLRHYGMVSLQRAPAPAAIANALDAYFRGRLDALTAIPRCTAGTPFQRTVWEALCTIPPGTTLSYLALAQRIGRPAAVRAVGLANGANPIGIVVPCHRVIGADGSLTGYGGGLPRKRWLLEHEGAHFTPGGATARRASANTAAD
jgi:methylated-DNA-[protein]-cysteine S-methyltransferase